MLYAVYFMLLSVLLCQHSFVQTAEVPSTPITRTTTSTQSSTSNSRQAKPTTTKSRNFASSPPDVYLNVPKLSVKSIQLEVENLAADINLNVKVAQLVQINAGVQISIQKVNLTITDVEAELELIVRLGHLADIINRVFQSIDLNPMLITAVNNVSSILSDVVGAVDGLLGTVNQNGKSLSFLVDSSGNIVQQVSDPSGNPVSTIVGNYAQNMTYTGQEQSVPGGLTQRTYRYAPLNAIVDIIFNSAGQVVQTKVQKAGRGATFGGKPRSAPNIPLSGNPPSNVPLSSRTSASVKPAPSGSSTPSPSASTKSSSIGVSDSSTSSSSKSSGPG